MTGEIDGGGTTRREVLAGAAALASTAVLGSVPSQAAGIPKDFLTASSRLCGIALDGSYLEMAGAVWQAVAAAMGEIDLQTVTALAATTPDSGMLYQKLVQYRVLEVAQTLIYTWYNGWINQHGRIDKVVAPVRIATDTADDQALMWRACDDWTKAPGDCGGRFGYWADAPKAGGGA